MVLGLLGKGEVVFLLSFVWLEGKEFLTRNLKTSAMAWRRQTDVGVFRLASLSFGD